MRPEALELEGFTAFRNRTRIEFGDADIVAFTGPTGAGKSSLIDAMIFALYGRTPRLGAGAVAPVISQGRSEARVKLDFVVGGSRYTAARVVRRTASGAVSTKEARLERAGDDDPLAAKVGELNDEVERLIGLDFEQFTTCVALPQGEFAQFLKEAPAKRQELLTRLLGLGVYRRMGQRAHELHSAGEGRIALRERDLDGLADATAATVAEREARLAALQTLRPRVSMLVDRLNEIELEIDRTTADRLQAASRITALTAIRTPPAVATLAEDSAVVRRLAAAAVDHLRKADAVVAESEEALADLGDGEELRRIRGEYDRLATLAAKVNAAKTRVDAAKNGAGEAAAELDAAEKALGKANQAREEAEREARGLTADVLRTRINALLRVEPPHDIDAIAVESRNAAERLRKAVEHRQEAETRETEANEDLRTKTTPRDGATLRALRRDHEARQRLVAEAAKASTRVDSTGRELREKEAQAAAASRTLAQAHSELEAMRRHHAAHELRVTLAPGEPCPVCEQDVATVPTTKTPPALAALSRAVAEADEARRQAEGVRDDARAKSSVASARLDDATQRAEEVRVRLEAEPPLDAVDAAINAIAKAEAHLEDLRHRLDACRHDEASARRDVEAVEDRVREVWRIHDGLRDELADLAPPPPDRDEPAASWRSLAAWAAHMREDLQAALDALGPRVRVAEHAARDRDLAARKSIDADSAYNTAKHLRDDAVDALRTLEEQLREAPSRAHVDALLACRASARKLLDAAQRLQAQCRQGVDATRREHDQLRHREERAWTDYHACRDEHSDLTPPAPEPGDLSASWAALSRWAADTVAQLQAEDEERNRNASRLAGAKAEAVVSLRAALADHDLDTDADSPVATVDAAILTASSDADRARERAERRREIELDLADARDKALVAAALREHLRANRFERWLLATAFRRLAEGAGRILFNLSGDRYGFKVGQGFEFEVVDYANAGETRSARTLSGGETFLASLALALALADHVAEIAAEGTARLESIFLDEGFGTLDPETLEIVTVTLEELHASGRMVGIVTHVPDLAERIPVRFAVGRASGAATVSRIES